MLELTKYLKRYSPKALRQLRQLFPPQQRKTSSSYPKTTRSIYSFLICNSNTMGGQSSNAGAQKARDSFASILSYYEKHVPAEEAPEFVKRASSGEIQIGVKKGDVPSAEQGAQLKRDLHEALTTQDAIANLSNAEKDLMTQAAQASLRSRKQKGSK